MVWDIRGMRFGLFIKIGTIWFSADRNLSHVTLAWDIDKLTLQELTPTTLYQSSWRTFNSCFKMTNLHRRKSCLTQIFNRTNAPQPVVIHWLEYLTSADRWQTYISIIPIFHDFGDASTTVLKANWWSQSIKKLFPNVPINIALFCGFSVS